MRVDHVPCGECVNESDRIAVEHVLSKLRSHGAPNNRWIVLSNVPSAVNDRAIPDEIDLVCIGPSGFFVIEVKHWDRAFLKSNQTAVFDKTGGERALRGLAKMTPCFRSSVFQTELAE